MCTHDHAIREYILSIYRLFIIRLLIYTDRYLKSNVNGCFNTGKFSSSLYSISNINNNTTLSFAIGSTCVLVPAFIVFHGNMFNNT